MVSLFPRGEHMRAGRSVGFTKHECIRSCVVPSHLALGIACSHTAFRNLVDDFARSEKG